jgi:hypothetical protein
VTLVVVAVVAGVLAGRALSPLRYRHLAPPRPRWVAVALAGVVVATVAERLDGDAAVWCAVVGQALLVVGVVANLHLVGAGVLAVGLGCNLLSMAVDGGIAVRPASLVEAGVVTRAELDGASLAGPRHLETDDDHLGVLGDAIPLSAFGTVVSFGDLIALVGIGDVAAHAARPLRRRRRSDSVVIDLRGHVPSDDELSARLRHPTGRQLVATGS